MKCLLSASLLFALAACATAPAGDDLAAYPAALVGAYDNSAQYAQAPDDMKQPRAADSPDDWLDLQVVSFRTVAVPALGPAVIYAEWRGGGGAVTRQRLWAFRRDGDAVRIDLYSLRDATRLASGPDAVALAALTADDVTGYGPACALAVRSNGRGAWNAQTDPDACRVTPRGQAEMTVDARVTVMPTGVLYQEAARLHDGAFVFRFPGGPPYDFRRRP